MWDNIAAYLISKGDVGVVALIAGGIIFYQNRGWRACELGRLEDAKAAIPVLQSAISAMSELKDEMAARSTMSAGFGEALRRLGDTVEKTHALSEALQDTVAPRKKPAPAPRRRS